MSRFQEGREEYVERQEKYKVITKVSRPENPVHAFAEHPNPRQAMREILKTMNVSVLPLAASSWVKWPWVHLNTMPS